jgi:hypothetical protein
MDLNDAFEFVDSVRPWLEEKEFSLAEHRTGLPFMGNIWRFRSSSVDLVISYDFRDRLVVGAGAIDGTSFEYRVWALLLGLHYEDDSDVFEQWSFFRSHITEIQRFAAHHEDLDGRLTDVNWNLIKEGLGFGPDEERPGRTI